MTIELDPWQIWMVMSGFSAAIPLFLWEENRPLRHSLINQFFVFVGLNLALIFAVLAIAQYLE